MKWGLIKLLCEYSDDFSSEEFKDLVDSVPISGSTGNLVTDHFVDFIHAFDTFENGVFVNGYSDSTEVALNNITDEEITNHKLNKHKLRKFYIARELKGLIDELTSAEGEGSLKMLNNKARSHLLQYKQLLDNVHKQSLSTRSPTGTMWSDDPSFVNNVNQMEKLAQILITTDINDIPNAYSKDLLVRVINRIERTLHHDLTHLYDIERAEYVKRKGKYEDEVQLSNHAFFTTSYYNSGNEVFERFNAIKNERDKLRLLVEHFNIVNRVSMSKQEGQPPFDPNNPPEDFIRLIHQSEQCIVDIAEKLDLI